MSTTSPEKQALHNILADETLFHVVVNHVPVSIEEARALLGRVYDIAQAAIAGGPTLDLAALSRAQAHLHATATDEAIERFNALPFLSQCAAAAQWAAGRDHVADYEAADRDRDWVRS